MPAIVAVELRVLQMQDGSRDAVEQVRPHRDELFVELASRAETAERYVPSGHGGRISDRRTLRIPVVEAEKAVWQMLASSWS